MATQEHNKQVVQGACVLKTQKLWSTVRRRWRENPKQSRKAAVQRLKNYMRYHHADSQAAAAKDDDPASCPTDNEHSPLGEDDDLPESETEATEDSALAQAESSGGDKRATASDVGDADKRLDFNQDEDDLEALGDARVNERTPPDATKDAEVDGSSSVGSDIWGGDARALALAPFFFSCYMFFWSWLC